MTIKPSPGNAAPRHVYGPRPLGAVLPAVTRSAFRSAGALAAQLIADWPAIAGPALAATMPRRLAAGTLTLGCTGPAALELQHYAPQIIERVNTHLGRPAVQRLRFVQQPRPPAGMAPAPARPAPPPVEVPGLPDGPLRDALAALGARIGAERA